MKFLIFISIVFFLVSCRTEIENKTKEKSIEEKIAVASDEKEATANFVNKDKGFLKERALLNSYPHNIKSIHNNYLYLFSGDSILFDDKKIKNYNKLLNESDIEDMFTMVYKLPVDEPDYLYDPGRSRSEALFKSMYGKTAAEVEKNLVHVEWFGQKVRFTSINGAADSLRLVANELKKFPQYLPFLKSSGTFYWREVRGAKRMSAHSYGIAFDIGVEKSDYWQWKLGSNDEMKKVKYANRIPLEIVKIFEKYGFIWGGSWYHYDTMHFEFRPEILEYAKLVSER